MLKHIIRYMLVPAFALVIVINGYKWFNTKFGGDAGNTSQVESSGEASIGGAFTLTNQNGEKISDKDFTGRMMLVYFGFTNCPDICPTDMATITQAMEELGSNADDIQPIFITIDPERDNIQQLKNFIGNFYNTFQALTGTAEEIAQVANEYRVYSKKVDSAELSQYTMDHSAYIYLMDRKGKYLTHFRHDQPVEEIVDGLRKYINF